MTQLQSGLTQKEITALYEKIDQSTELSQAIKAQIDKMTDEQYEALQQRQLEKMTPEQRALAEQFQQQAGSEIIHPLDLFTSAQNQLVNAFQAVNARIAANQDVSLTDQIAALTASAEAAKAMVALQGAIVAETQHEETANHAAKPSGPGTGQYL